MEYIYVTLIMCPLKDTQRHYNHEEHKCTPKNNNSGNNC